MSREFLRTHGPETWNSKHSPTAPYYLEYQDLFDDTAGRGIRLFDPTFTFENYFRVEDPLPSQQAYLHSLLSHAHHQDQRPVLGFCKSLGRLPWIRRYFPEAVHITFVRDPIQQWLSGYQFYVETQNPYFLIYSSVYLKEPGDSAYIRALQGKFPDLMASSTTFDVNRLFEAFMHIYGYSTIVSAMGADLVVDIDRVSSSAAYRRFIERRLFEVTGTTLDLSDCRIGHHRVIPVGLAERGRHVLHDLTQWVYATDSITDRYDTSPWAVLEKIETALQIGDKSAGAPLAASHQSAAAVPARESIP